MTDPHGAEGYECFEAECNDPHGAEGYEEIDFGDIQDTSDIINSQHVANITPESSENKLRKRQIINKIRKYKELFKKDTDEFDTSYVWVRSLSDLETLLENVEFCVAVRQSGKHSRTIFLSGLQIWEQLGKKLRFQLDGLTGVAAQSPELMETVDECSIKYSNDMAVDPLYRLAMHIGQLSLAIHHANSSWIIFW